MTIQDLKDSKNEILERISEIGNTHKTKEIMQAMLNLVNGNMYDADNAVDLVDEVVEMSTSYQKTFAPSLWGNGCKYSTQAEYQRSCLGSKFN